MQSPGYRSRGDLLLGFTGILSFAALEKYRLTGKFGWIALHGAAFVLAMLSKETAIVLPVVFAAYLAARGSRDFLRAPFLGPAAIWLFTALSYLLLRDAAMKGLPTGEAFGLGPLAGSLRVLPETLGALFACFDIPVVPSFTPAATAAGLCAAAGITIALWAQKKLRRPMVILGALWFILLSIPGMMYRHFNAYDYLNHRAYLPMTGIFILFAEVIPVKWYKKSRWAFISVASVAIMALSILAWRQSGYFADPSAFYNEAIRTNPGSALARYNRGKVRYDHGDYRQAIIDFDDAIRLYPGYARAYCNRGNSKGWLGDYRGAVADIEKAVALLSHGCNQLQRPRRLENVNQ